MLTGRDITPQEPKAIGVVHSVTTVVEELLRTLDGYLMRLSRCAPRSAATCKELIRMGWAEPGTERLDDKIERTFAGMLAPGSEGEHGLQQFRQKVKGVD